MSRRWRCWSGRCAVRLEYRLIGRLQPPIVKAYRFARSAHQGIRLPRGGFGGHALRLDKVVAPARQHEFASVGELACDPHDHLLRIFHIGDAQRALGLHIVDKHGACT